MRFICFIVLALFAGSLPAWPAPSWRLSRSPHFEVYSHAGDESTRAILRWFEQLRAFFLSQSELKLEHAPPVRVIAFGSAAEYAPYRLHAATDAYSVTGENQNYVVMVLGPGAFRIAAHEYAHIVLRASGLRVPPWLEEGLAEFFSTIQVSERATGLGGDLPARSQTLRRHSWMPLSEVVSLPADSPVRHQPPAAQLFYAEVWALTDMLLVSPEYRSRFPQLMIAVGSGEPALDSLARIYSKSADAITRDLHAWIEQPHKAPLQLPALSMDGLTAESSDVSPAVARQRLADVLAAAGELDRAEMLYLELDREAPDAADIPAALGTIAFRKGDLAGARREWKKALDRGIQDAGLCFRYAVLGERAGLPTGEIRAVLERAVALQPAFDDALYYLALLEKNSGEYESTVEHLQKMHSVTAGRAYAYWLALADSLNELGRRDDAKIAALKAAEHANSPAQRTQANQLAYITQTDIRVQLARDSAGRTQMVTTRAPHEAPTWNPFIEAQDDLRRVQGTLKEIDCSEQVTRFVIDTEAKRLRLAIPDPSHVQMRNAPAEFVCGPQKPAAPVLVEYAASSGGEGIVRGMEFR